LRKAPSLAVLDAMPEVCIPFIVKDGACLLGFTLGMLKSCFCASESVDTKKVNNIKVNVLILIMQKI
jgi:hypothetical protein